MEAGRKWISLLAKELELGAVIYDVPCNDAETIGKCLDVPADHFVQGDVTELLDFLKLRNIHCDMELLPGTHMFRFSDAANTSYVLVVGIAEHIH